MLRYALRRLLESIPTMLGITILTFLLAHLVPGNPALAMLGPHATHRAIAVIDHQFGLDKPLPVQYVIWLWQVLHGNLGISYTQNLPVTTLIWQALPRTLAIVGIGTVIADVLSVIQGLYQAHHQGRPSDNIVTLLAYFFYSMPTFWLGVLLIIWFSIDLPIFPPGGISDPGQTMNFVVWFSHISLPVITLVIVTVAFWGRFMRASVIESLVQDYIRTARAKGLHERTVLYRHAFRNSLLPLITLFGFSLPTLFAGALFIEEVFNYPGLGLLFWHAALTRDYPTVFGITLIIGILTILGNLTADLLYAVADPRIRYN
ncbi:MAG: ABC transporter permease [Thermaerobacter sp.]|nr:ABC transporter permease [Thermaerobacter sp.]